MNVKFTMSEEKIRELEKKVANLESKLCVTKGHLQMLLTLNRTLKGKLQALVDEILIK